MGITSQREVRELSRTFKLTVILSIITAIIATIIYFSIPWFSEFYERKCLENDLKSIEYVYTEMQALIDEESVMDMPLGFWDMSLSDFSQMTTLKDFNEELCRRLKVSSLSELEGEGFKSKAFKGSRYMIYMYDGTKELHLIVQSNDQDEHMDVEY